MPEFIRIYTRKFNATIKRLSTLDDLDYSDVPAVDAVATFCLYRCLREIRQNLRFGAIITFQEWRKYKAGLRAIGKVSFVGLRCNLRRITTELELIDRARYFD